MTLGEKISRLRRDKKMSQEDLAEALNISRQAVSKWENSLSNPDTEKLIRLAQILGVDINELVQCEMKEESPDTPADKGRKRESTALIVVCAIALLSLCASVIFALLWYGERQGRLSQTEPTVQETQSRLEWDAVRMYDCSNMKKEEVPLTIAQQAELADVIWHHYFEEKTEDGEEKTLIYGGYCFAAEFERNGILWRFWFSPNVFSCQVTAETVEVLHEYQVDLNYLYELAEFTEKITG